MLVRILFVSGGSCGKSREINKVFTSLLRTLYGALGLRKVALSSIVPLTDGNKTKMRHQSCAVTLHYGALKLFLTYNFADTYSPITLLLYGGSDAHSVHDDQGLRVEDGAEIVGAASVNLFEDC